MPRPAGSAPLRSPASRFRDQIESAIAEGVAPDQMTLRLTHSDINKIRRDREIPIEAVSFAGGVMRYLGVKVELGGVEASTLVRGA